MQHAPEWLSIIAPFMSGAFGVGIAWGIIRQKFVEVDRRLTKMEKRIEDQVGDIRCTRMRDECKNGISDKIDEIKEEIVSNRNWVTDRFTEIARFMGSHNGDR